MFSPECEFLCVFCVYMAECTAGVKVPRLNDDCQEFVMRPGVTLEEVLRQVSKAL